MMSALMIPAAVGLLSALVYAFVACWQARVHQRLYDKYPPHADAIAKWTLEYAQALEVFRNQKVRRTRPPMDHNEVAAYVGTPRADYKELYEAVLAISPGKAGATAFHRAVRDLLTALFYPALIHPQIEREINEGRKRVDLVYANVASTGFFRWVAQHYGAPHIVIECKNYSADLGNDELDQLTGRFSPRRGRIGLLVCRRFEKKELFLKRCRDSANDGHGYVIVLDDDDLGQLVEVAHASEGSATETALEYSLLRDRFEQLVM
jgi:hypothetical protein